jgi:hypothetical protein
MIAMLNAAMCRHKEKHEAIRGMSYIFTALVLKNKFFTARERVPCGTVSKRVITGLFSYLIVSFIVGSEAMAATPYPGYIFCASGMYGYLISPTGETVHSWKASGSARSNAYLLPDGSALFPISTNCKVRGDGAYPHGRLQKISWDGAILWDAVVCDATFTPGYDLDPMPNGNVIVGGATNTGGLKIVEVKPSGASGATVVWSYALPDSLCSGSAYINSLSYNPDLDYILIDLNGVRKLVVIDHKGAGGIVYTYLVGTSGFTHAAEWVHKNYLGTNIPVPGADTAAMRLNNLLVVHNNTEAVEVNYKTKTLVKSIKYAYDQHEGSVQRLPNGNTLVQKGNSSKVITELDDNGQTVRTVNAPATIARAYMYGPAYPGLKNYMSPVKTAGHSPACAYAFAYNTATGTVKISVAKSTGMSHSLRIFDLSGKTVYSVSMRGSEFVISTRSLAAGVYYIDVYSGSTSFRTNFVRI